MNKEGEILDCPDVFKGFWNGKRLSRIRELCEGSVNRIFVYDPTEDTIDEIVHSGFSIEETQRNAIYPEFRSSGRYSINRIRT